MYKGFTLAEIMIVVMIIALLAAITVPNLLRSKMNANESAAIKAVRTLTAAMAMYSAGTGSFSNADLSVLGSATPPYIDKVLGCSNWNATISNYICLKQGYNFELRTAPSWVDGDRFVYYIRALPQTENVTGRRYFCAVTDGVIRWGNSDPASWTNCRDNMAPLN